MRRFLLPSLVAAAALACATTAGAATVVRTGWHETISVSGKPVLAVGVETITYAATGWSAAVSIRNLAKSRVTLGDSFGLLVHKDAKTTDPAKGGFDKATAFKPARPKQLAPGATWIGTIGGSGVPAAGLYGRVVFGPFAGIPGNTGFYWITDHVQQVPGKAATPAKPKSPQLVA